MRAQSGGEGRRGPTDRLGRTGRQTPVSEESPIFDNVTAELDEAIARANRFGLKAAQARTIAGEVKAAVSRWRSIGTHAGIPASAVTAWADALALQ